MKSQKFVFSRHFEFLKQVGMSIKEMSVCSSDMGCGLLWVSLWLNFWDDALSFYMTLWQTQFILQPQTATCNLSKLQLDLLISKVEFQITFSFPISFTKNQLKFDFLKQRISIIILNIFFTRYHYYHYLKPIHIRHPLVFAASRFEQSLISL